MSELKRDWRYNMLGPSWFRRLRTAWRWYWSGHPMITIHDVEHLLREADRE